MSFNLHTVRQSLAARHIRVSRVDPYPDGRCRFAVWPEGERAKQRMSDDPEELYIFGLRMASARDQARQQCGRLAYA